MSDEKKANQTETSIPNPTGRLSALASKLGGSRGANFFGIPQRYREYTIRNYPLDMQERATGFICDEVDTLYLVGGIGSRKTSFAAAILRAWRWVHPEEAERWRNGIFLPMYRAADILRSLDKAEEDRQEWKNTPLLVLDDVGANRATAFLAEQLLFLLEERYDWNQQTIVTSNLSLEEFGKAVDPRAASRLQEGMVLDLGEKDWRQGD